MTILARVACIVLLAIAAPAGGVVNAFANPPQASARYEVTVIKSVRPTLVNTIAALKKGDLAAAKAAFDAYDAAWNGVEIYINIRSKEMYGELEQTWQAKIAKGLSSPSPDAAALATDATAMLAKYDEAIAMVEQGAPLNPLYDDVTRLRIVRTGLREVNPALKAGDFAKARDGFADFNDKWDSIEDLVKARSQDSYTEIERGMIQIERALMPEKPDVNATSALVSGVLDKYNAIIAQVTREARTP